MTAIRPALMAAAMTVAALAAGLGPASANADDAAWIKACVADNGDQHQTASVVASYCSCMNDKMPKSATVSITTWEKTHVAEQEACSKEAGWKGK